TAITQTATVNFKAGSTSATNSQVYAFSPVAADGISTTIIFVEFYYAQDNPVSNETVSISATGNAHLNASTGVTNSNGFVEFTATDTTAETVIFQVTDPEDMVVIAQTATVVFVPG